MDITIMRGTTNTIVLPFADSDGNPITLEGDIVGVFRIKSNPSANANLYQKVLTSANEQTPGLFAFNIFPSDTESWDYGTYYYDYGVQYAANDYRALMEPAKFIVSDAIAGRIDSSDIHYAEIENGSVTTIKLANEAVTLQKLHHGVTAVALGGAAAEHDHNDLYYKIDEVDSKIEDVWSRSSEAASVAKNEAISSANSNTTTEINKLKNGGINAAAIAAGAVSTAYSVTVGTGWSGSAAPYSISVTVNGMLATDKPIVGLVPSATYADAANQVPFAESVKKASL